VSDERAERRRRERADRKGQWAKEQEEHEIEREWELDPSWKAYVTHIRESVAPMVHDSGLTISIVPRRPQDVDVKFAVELGLSIMFDKPIILCVPYEDAELPGQLLRVADHVVVGQPSDPEVRERMMAAITAVKDKLDQQEGDQG
jgi:hypothetical protein